MSIAFRVGSQMLEKIQTCQKSECYAKQVWSSFANQWSINKQWENVSFKLQWYKKRTKILQIVFFSLKKQAIFIEAEICLIKEST